MLENICRPTLKASWLDDDDSMSSPTFSEPSQLEVDEDLQFDEDKEQRWMEMMMQAASNRLQNKDDEELIQYSELKYVRLHVCEN